MTDKLELEELERIIANPFYCINIDATETALHEPLISEDDWVECAKKSMKEDNDGGEKFLRHLLENLKGNYIG